jgi:hypothetical protein
VVLLIGDGCPLFGGKPDVAVASLKQREWTRSRQFISLDLRGRDAPDSAAFRLLLHFGPETAMALKIICVIGPGSTGKSSIIREFTAKHLKYERAEGDVLGIFLMPWRNYAVGVNGSGDNPDIIRQGFDFLNRYDDLTVMIVACHSRGKTFQEVKRFEKKAKAILHLVETEKLSTRERDAATSAKVSEIFHLMPGR